MTLTLTPDPTDRRRAGPLLSRLPVGLKGLFDGRLELNALALMITTVATAVLGLVFWTVAARLYAPTQVGLGSATISTLTLLAGLAQFNLGNVYGRFLPTSGRSSRRFVFTGYAAVAVSGLLLGAGFLALGFGAAIVTTTSDRWWFPVLVAVLAIFTLQDYVLVAIQAAKVVPVENIIFSVVKIVLLVVLAGHAPHRGITISWVIPAAIGVLIISAVLRVRGLPHAGSAGAPAGSLPGPRALGSVVAGEYVTGAIQVIIPMGLPLIVVWRLGAEANAYFAMPWLIATAVTMLTWNVASSLLVEAALDPAQARALVRRALRLTLVIGSVGSVLQLAAAPLVLGVLGSGYATRGTDLLRVLALTIPANAVLVTWATLMRIHGRMIVLILQQTVTTAAVLVLTVLLLPGLGVTGAGVGYLIVQGGCAVVVLPPLVRMLRRGPGELAASVRPPARHLRRKESSWFRSSPVRARKQPW